MAAEEDKDEKDNEKPASKKKLVIIIAMVVVLLAVVGVGAFFAMNGGKGSADDEEEAEGEDDSAENEEGEGEALPGAVVPLETFIVNLQVRGSFLKTTVQLQLTEPELPPHFETHVPKIRDTIIRILSSKQAADILNAEGKEQLRQEIRDSVNETLESEDITGVYFTEFIIQ